MMQPSCIQDGGHLFERADAMPCYAIRSIYLFETKDDGMNVFEERTVCFDAADWESAFEQAEEESRVYEAEAEVVRHPEQSGYEMDGAPVIPGSEVWSELFESRDTLNEFYANRYTKYAYHPPA